MPLSVKKINDKYRLVGPNGKPELNDSGKPIDGGGHTTKKSAVDQMNAINISKKENKASEVISKAFIRYQNLIKE